MFKEKLSKQYFLDLYARLFCRSRYQKINNFLLSCGLRGLGIYNSQNLLISGELNFLKKYLSKIDEPIIFDVGANEGEYALLCKQINDKSKIFCFEPHPITFSALNSKIEDSSNIISINQALSNCKGKLKLYDYAERNGSRHATLCYGVIEKIHKQTSDNIEVDVSTLDDFLETRDIKDIDLLKIDVEGNEIKVLQGAKRTLEKGYISAIQFEFTQINSTSKVFIKDFFDLLEDRYELYRLLSDGLLPLNEYSPTKHEIFGYQNIVCLRKNEV